MGNQDLSITEEFTLDALKQEYMKNDIVMTEFLRNYPNLSNRVRAKLLRWAGEEEYVEESEEK